MSEKNEQNSELQEDSVASTQETQEAAAGNEQTATDNTSELNVEDQVAALNDKYLRLYSEFDNYRKRTNKERLELISSASAGILKDLTSVLDDFERAIANNEKVDDLEAVKNGFQLIYGKFKSLLEAKGLKQMEAKGQAFDADLHEAIANIPAPTPELVGKVVDDVEKGYYLNDKVIRFAKVVVGQ